jgi:hypothetical protein
MPKGEAVGHPIRPGTRAFTRSARANRRRAGARSGVVGCWRLLSPCAASLQCRRSWVRIPSSASRGTRCKQPGSLALRAQAREPWRTALRSRGQCGSEPPSRSFLRQSGKGVATKRPTAQTPPQPVSLSDSWGQGHQARGNAWYTLVTSATRKTDNATEVTPVRLERGASRQPTSPSRTRR